MYTAVNKQVLALNYYWKGETVLMKTLKAKQTSGNKTKGKQQNSNSLEMPGIEPGAFHMQSERSTTELHPLHTPNSAPKKHPFMLIEKLFRKYHITIFCTKILLLLSLILFI